MSKSLQLYPLVYPDEPDPSTFKAGTGWLKQFKNRHGVRALSVQGESLSAGEHLPLNDQVEIQTDGM